MLTSWNPTSELAADETYIKISGVKAYVWLIMDKVSRSILGYQVSTSRDVGPCILTMRMVFDKFKEFPGKWKLLIFHKLLYTTNQILYQIENNDYPIKYVFNRFLVLCHQQSRWLGIICFQKHVPLLRYCVGRSSGDKYL